MTHSARVSRGRYALLAYTPCSCEQVSTTERQDAYLSYIVQAEKLDAFMREATNATALFGGGHAGLSRRDDEAARAMYSMKALSKESFRQKLK